MNEKFLSRGKREDTGKWVEGYYIELPKDQHGEQLHIIIDLNGQYHRIIPETAGRCVSLTDKNNKLMFEGDIVTGYFDHEKIIGSITYGSDATFFIQRAGLFGIGLNNAADWLSVIGNIHDNKQMLSRADMPVSNDVFQPVFQPTTPENFEIMQA